MLYIQPTGILITLEIQRLLLFLLIFYLYVLTYITLYLYSEVGGVPITCTSKKILKR